MRRCCSCVASTPGTEAERGGSAIEAACEGSAPASTPARMIAAEVRREGRRHAKRMSMLQRTYPRGVRGATSLVFLVPGRLRPLRFAANPVQDAPRFASWGGRSAYVRENAMSEVGTPPQAAGEMERRLATILCADVAGYSRMMGEDEERTVRVFRGHRAIFESLVAEHRGRIFNTAGDALLAEFSSAVEAVRCATDIQAALRTRNEHLDPAERMQFRIGINLGDVIVQGVDLLGDGVNVAARIQQSTEPGGICISGSVHEQIQNKLSLEFKLLGELPYKNIAKPIRTYTIN